MMRNQKKKTNWQRLKEDPEKMQAYRTWRRQYLNKKKRRNKRLQSHNDESKPQLNRFDKPVRQGGGRLSDLEARIERIEKELGMYD